MEMNKVLALVVSLISLTCMSLVFADNSQPPELPAFFSGSLTINVEPAPASTEIVAKMDGEIRGTLTTAIAGEYGLSGQKKLFVVGSSPNDNGKTIYFYINGVETAQTSIWNSGAVYTLDISATISTGTSATISAETSHTKTSSTSSSSHTTSAPSVKINVLEPKDSEILKIRTEEATQISITNLDSVPSNIPPIGGLIYKYVDIQVGEETSGTIHFRVSRDWIDANSIEVDTITLNRYHNNKWDNLLTMKADEDNEYLYFEAETLGFSIFAITGQKVTKFQEESRCKRERTKAYDPDTLECVEYPSECDVPSGWLVLGDGEKCPVRAETIREKIGAESVSAAAPPTGLLIGAMPGTVLASLFILLIAGIYMFGKSRKP